MIDPHEDLVEAVARKAFNAFRYGARPVQEDEWPILGKDGRENWFRIARAAIDLIAERTKDATPAMIDACRQMQADQHFGVTTLWTAMHRACALWPKEKS